MFVLAHESVEVMHPGVSVSSKESVTYKIGKITKNTQLFQNIFKFFLLEYFCNFLNKLSIFVIFPYQNNIFEVLVFLI